MMASPIVANEPPLATMSHDPKPTSAGDNESNNSAQTDSGDENEGASVKDAIREGKEKAKAVMAASGMNIASEAQSNPSSTPDTTAQAVKPTTNGTSQGRKRSRSGSHKPMEPGKASQIDATTEHGKYRLSLYFERDQYFSANINTKGEESGALSADLNSRQRYYGRLAEARRHNPAGVAHEIYGWGYAGYGNGHTQHNEFRIVYPSARPKPGRRRARRNVVTRQNNVNQADQLEELVPMRLDIEHDKIKLRDTFTWNLHDHVTNLDAFAETLVEDFQVPPEHIPYVLQQVKEKIDEQRQEYYPHVYIEEEPLDPHLPYAAYKNDEMRILIKLNITIGPYTLMDQFEWDINDSKNSPEEFARQMTRDLALSGEFTTAIAHQIREQSQMFTKSLYITAHPFDGRPIEDSDIANNFLPSPMPSVFRPVQTVKDYSPYLWELTEQDLQKEELSILREQRRQKRSVTRRGGPALPDLKDRDRTVRSLVVSSVLPGAAETLENARVFKMLRASGRRGRGAARADGASDDDDSESDDSDLEAEVTQQITGGTARTRGMRGAATAAQAAMRANLGRSATPELASLHHHETRTSRRSGYETREESVAEPTSLVVTLRISREKYRQWMRNYKSRAQGEYQQPAQVSTPLMASQTNTPQHPSNLHTSSSMPPPPSPAPPPRSTPASSSRNPPAAESSRTSTSGTVATDRKWRYHPDGRVDAPFSTQPENREDIVGAHLLLY
jgi:SWI/SNF-related matrix-associated actin-dependent regulator of chromatin subfamily B protein 1